jgi:ribosomal protein S18 acetylase RimI-like enzyme
LPGVLVGDPELGAVCQRNGYREIDRVVILQRDLSNFRPPITRTQLLLRRETAVREEPNPVARSWWVASTTGVFDQLRFSLELAAGGAPLAEVSFWDIEPLSTGWGVATSGMHDLQVTSARRRQGLATYLLSEVFTRLTSRGIVRVEAQTMQTNTTAIALYKNLGFEQVDEGVVFRKES